MRLLNGSFRDIERVNRYFGGIEPVRAAILALRPRTVLDVGCGVADLPRAIVEGARRVPFPIRITGLDASSEVLSLASSRAATYPEIAFVRGTGEEIPFPDDSFDAAICTLTLHHCEPPAAVKLLQNMRRVARHVYVADLRRCRAGLIGALAFSRGLSCNLLTRHDAPMSIRRAYTPIEALKLAYAAGWSRPTVRATPFFRMVLSDAA